MLLKLAPALFVLLWSSGFIAAKIALPYAEPATFLFLRFAVVVALAGVVGLVMRAPLRGGIDLLHAGIAGAMMLGLYLSAVLWSMYAGMPAGVVALVVSLHPISTAVLSSLWLGERISVVGWLGFVLGVIGAGLVLWPKLDLGASGIRPQTIGLALLALPAMSFGTVYQKRFAGQADVVAATVAQHVGAMLVVGLIAAAFETRVVDWAPTMVATLAWQSLALSVGAFGLLLLMIRARAASRASSMFYFIPAASAAMAFVLLGERLEPIQLFGVVVVSAAVFLISHVPSTKSLPVTRPG
jgi:drug/metabolite transporter (DMT)-like permease